MSTQDFNAGYAFWTAPDKSSKVTYSLAVFSEIDSLVNDGYRRIPHGGVETGGILFGTRSTGSLNIEAYRPIHCQHAYGPSFILSDADLVALRDQLANAVSDPELQGLQPLGWFIGHTRSPLQMSEREVLWFDEFFPDPGSITILIKPERFHPTRFGFLLRGKDGQVVRDAAQNAVILPLSGLAPASSIPEPLPSIPAPSEETNFETGPTPAVSQVAKPPVGEVTRVRISQDALKPASPPRPSVPLITPVPPISNVPSGIHNAAPERTGLAFPYASLAPERTRAQKTSNPAFGLKSIAILLLAAVLGCFAGYWAYRQLPSPVIPVSVREEKGQLIVEWPSAQTDDVDYAALQVNDGQWTSLSPAQKTSGHATVSAPTGDVKIDLLAKHWLRDSRGIVRYIRTVKAPTRSSPATNQR